MRVSLKVGVASIQTLYAIANEDYRSPRYEGGFMPTQTTEPITYVDTKNVSSFEFAPGSR